VSDTWHQIRGIDPKDSQSTNQKWQDLVHSSDLPVLLAHHDRQNRGETDEVNYQYRSRSSQGEWVWIQSRGRVVTRDASGAPDRVIGTDTNVTNYKIIEQQMQAQSERLKLAIEVSEVGMWHFVVDEQTVHWDEQIRQIYGVTDGIVARHHTKWEDYLHPDDVEGFLQITALSVRQAKFAMCGARPFISRTLTTKGPVCLGSTLMSQKTCARLSHLKTRAPPWSTKAAMTR
jgi:PAS domain-containing protein